jgi:hypothetical protein
VSAVEFRGMWLDEEVARMLDKFSKELPQMRESLDAKNREFDALELPYPEPFATDLENEIDLLQRDVAARTGLPFERAFILLGVVS